MEADIIEQLAQALEQRIPVTINQNVMNQAF
jgi:hypothetical protein